MVFVKYFHYSPTWGRIIWKVTGRGAEMKEWTEKSFLKRRVGSVKVSTLCFFCPDGIHGSNSTCWGFTPCVIVIFCLPTKCTSSSSGRTHFSGTLKCGLTHSFLNKDLSRSQSLLLSVGLSSVQLLVLDSAVGLLATQLTSFHSAHCQFTRTAPRRFCVTSYSDTCGQQYVWRSRWCRCSVYVLFLLICFCLQLGFWFLTFCWYII